jgi:hypothetical protein
MSATTTLSAPEWLTLRAGAIKPGVRPETRFVLVGSQPLYKLEARPAAGKFICAVTNTVNGKRLDEASFTYASAEEAFTGGLEQLRNKLGW